MVPIVGDNVLGAILVIMVDYSEGECSVMRIAGALSSSLIRGDGWYGPRE
jgi:hypothetical protein